MNENFLSFIWKFRLYSSTLKTTCGKNVTVVKPGEQNSNSGPDFFNARIQIDNTLWAGNVEIHVRASDWYRHRHQSDKAYGNVILHVVFEADMDVITGDLTTIPTVALRDQTDPGVLKRYLSFRNSKLHIPCGNNLSSINPLNFSSWMDRMLVERLEYKSVQIEQALSVNRGDWEDAFYQLLARNFGFNVNAGPFEMLARCVPRGLLLRHSTELHLAEALLFGQAGFLEEDHHDEYPSLLGKEYKFLSRKYGLIPLDRHIWKLLRMRPANFPTIRISQFAALILSGKFTFGKVLDETNANLLQESLRVPASPYWNNHYLFDRVTKYGSRILGHSSSLNILVNTVAPALFYYGRSRGEDYYCDRAFDLLKSLPSENHHIIKEWERWGVSPENAFAGQALTGLYNSYCSQKKCLFCSLGTEILRKNESTD